MPVNYSYIRENHTIDIYCSGCLTITEINQYFIDIDNDDGIPRETIEIVDLTGVNDFPVTSIEASAMPALYRKAHDGKAIQGTILIGAGEANYGMARMIQTYFNSIMPGHAFIVVRSREEAHVEIQRIRQAA